MGSCDSLCISSNPRKNNANNAKNNSSKGHYTFPNGDYYVGPLNNNLPNGQGKRFTPNGKIRYDGNFVNGCAQGQGKLYWDNGEYYVGEWLNNARHGKGKMYYTNGKIKYNGNFANDKYDGYGQYVWENGECYIGEWSNGLRHGKGAIYYSNGYLKQQGNYVNDNYEGESNIGTNYNIDNINDSGILKNGAKKVEVNFGSVTRELEYADGYIYGDINPPPFKGN